MKRKKPRSAQLPQAPRRGPGAFAPEPFRSLAGADCAAAAALWACSLGLYLATLCPTVATGDSAEFATVAACWGVSHAPGYPLYTLLNALFVRLFPFGELAWRVNLLTALWASLAVSLLFVLCRGLGARLPAALAAAACFGTGSIFWGQALAAEVYTLDICLILLAWSAALRLAGAQAARDYFLFGLAAGLMAGHRVLNVAYFMPALLAFAWTAWRASARTAATALCALFGAACSGLVFAYLPVASSLDPPADWGDPDTARNFFAVVTGGNFKYVFGAAPLALKLRKAAEFFTAMPANLGIAALAAPAGLWLLARQRRWLPAGCIAYAVLCCLFFAAQYHVFDYTVFFLPGIAMLCLAASLGFDLVPGRLAWAAALLALVNLPLQYAGRDLSQARLCRQYGTDALASAPPGAVVLVRTDTENNVLGYLQVAQGLRPDVAVCLATPMAPAAWYAGLLRRRYPLARWPAHDSAYYYRTGQSWVADLLDGNLPDRPVCMLDPPDIQLRELGLERFLPRWQGMPDGVLYCLESPARADDTAQRLAANQRFWQEHDRAGPPAMPDSEFQIVRGKYLKARYFHAEALAGAGMPAEAAGQLRALLAAQPDALEDRLNDHYRRIGMRPSRAVRIGKRAEKALQTLPAAAR